MHFLSPQIYQQQIFQQSGLGLWFPFPSMPNYSPASSCPLRPFSFSVSFFAGLDMESSVMYMVGTCSILLSSTHSLSWAFVGCVCASLVQVELELGAQENLLWCNWDYMLCSLKNITEKVEANSLIISCKLLLLAICAKAQAVVYMATASLWVEDGSWLAFSFSLKQVKDHLMTPSEISSTRNRWYLFESLDKRVP